MATSTVEDYLKHILMQQTRQAGGLVSTGSIAEVLEVTPGTATAMVKTLADSGLLEYEPYSGVRLTEAGRQLATHVLRRHRLVELFLVQVLGMDWSEVHDEAERLEHAVSERVLQRMDQFLGHPSVDPHGDPIPNAHGVVQELELPSLLLCPEGEDVEVARVSDQTPGFLQDAERRGIRLGRRLVVTERSEAADAVELCLDGGDRVSLGFRAAAKILVRPVAGQP